MKKKTLPEQLDRVIELLQWMKEDAIQRTKDHNEEKEKLRREMEEMKRNQTESFRKESDINVNKFKEGLIEGLEKSGMKELAEAARRKRLEEEEWKKRISGGGS
jgi:hypothetical protein